MFDGWFTRQLLFDGARHRAWSSGWWRWASCSSTGRPGSSTSPSANIGFIGAGLFALLVAQYNVPFWLAAVVGIVVGTLYGALIELIVIRRLFTAPRVIVLVATIGIAQLSLAILTALPRDRRARRPLPACRSASVHEVAGRPDRRARSSPSSSSSRSSPSASAGCSTARRSARRSRRRPRTPTWPASPASARRWSRPLVWAARRWPGHAVARRSWPARPGSAQNLDNLGPSTLTRALAAAVIAGMVSFPRAFLAGIAIGIVQAVISFNYLDQPGLTDFLVLIAIVIAVYWQSRPGPGRDPDLRVRGQGQTHPRAPARHLVGAPDRPHRPGRSWSSAP